MHREQIIAFARTLVGTPWAHQGRRPGPTGGLDCIGIITATADHFGLPYRDRRNYPRYVMDPEILIAALSQYMRPLTVDEVGLGDVGICRIARVYHHVVLRTDRGVIHAYDAAGGGKVIESENWARWARRLIFGFSFLGIDKLELLK